MVHELTWHWYYQLRSFPTHRDYLQSNCRAHHLVPATHLDQLQKHLGDAGGTKDGQIGGTSWAHRERKSKSAKDR